MARLAEVQRVYQEASGRFRVRYPAGVRSFRGEDGQILRRTVYRQKRFTSERAAREWLTDYKREQQATGEDAHLISKGAKRSLVSLAAKVKLRGGTLEGILGELASCLDTLEQLRDPVSGTVPGLLSSVQEHCRAALPSLGTKPAREEIERFLDQTDERARVGIIQKDYAKDFRNRLERFTGSKLAARPLGFFGTREGAAALKKWLDALPVGTTTWNNYRRHLSIFFEWAVKQEKLRKNPCEQIEQRRKSREEETEPGIISPAELRTLLLVSLGELPGVRTDERWSPALAEMLPGIALQAFCGIRARELTRLTWEDLDIPSGLLTVSKRKAKTRRGRIVPLPAALSEWLSPWIGRSGPIAPPQYDRKLSTLRRSMRKPPELRKGSPAFPACEMPDNCLRHSFGTYHLALSKNEAETSRLMGNSPEVLRGHYEAILKRAVLQAPEWFQVRPKSSVLEIGTARAGKRSSRKAS
jgi:integrase